MMRISLSRSPRSDHEPAPMPILAVARITDGGVVPSWQPLLVPIVGKGVINQSF